MAKQEIRATPVVPNGTLDFNTHADDIKEGNLTASLNTRVQNNEYETVGARQNIKGTRLAFAPDAVNAQNKIFRFYFDTNRITDAPTQTVTFYLYSPNNVQLAIVGYSHNDTTIAQVLSSFTAALPLFLLTETYNVSTTVTSATEGYADLEITTISYWDYQITKSLSANSPLDNVEAIQEAIDVSAAGNLIALPTKDLLGDLFCLYTTKQEVSSSIQIVGGTNNGSGLYTIETAEPYDLLINSRVSISGTLTDGVWMIQPLTATTFTLVGSTYTADFTGGTLYINEIAISEIGVGQYNENTDTWTYTRLLRTSEWNLRADRQPEIGIAEENNYGKALYFTDGYNPDRVFYYKGDYVTDGALKVNGGRYVSGTIDEETRLILGDQGLDIRFQSQNSTGGALLSGGYKYSGYFSVDGSASTLPLQPTGLVPVYAPNQAGVPQQIAGSNGGDLTPKKNNLTVTFPANLYTEFFLIAIYYTGGSISATKVKRYIIAEGQTTLTVTHTGAESTVEDYDVGLLNLQNTVFNISRTIRAIKNRATRSNVKSSNTYDLSPWARTFLHSIEQESLTPSIGSVTNSTLAYGDYQVPENVCYKGDSMLFECYRYGLKAEWMEGGISDAFWIDDIRIDGNTYNIDPAYPDDRRDGNALNGVSYGLTDSSGEIAKVIYVDFHGYDVNFLIEGIPVSKLIRRMWIVRAEVVRECLGNGVMVLGVSGKGTGNSPIPLLPYIYYSDATTPQIGMFPYFSGHTLNTWYDGGAPGAGNISAANNIPYDGALVGLGQERRFGFFHMMDMWTSNQAITPLNGDTILSYGNPNTNAFQVTPATRKFQSNYVEQRGYTLVNFEDVISVTIDEGKLMYTGQENVSLAGATVSNVLKSESGTGTVFTWYNIQNYALHFTTDLNNNSGYTDYGTYACYYYRGISTYDANYNPDTSKYGLRDDTRYTRLLAEFNIADIDGSSGQVMVYSQDVYNSTSWMKMRHIVSSSAGTSQDEIGFGGGIKFFSQNITNTSLIVKSVDNSQWNYPNEPTLAEWLDIGIDKSYLGIQYDSGYNYPISPVSTVAYNTLTDKVTAQPATLYYSDIKVLNTVVDAYRIWKPLNFSDSPLTHGQITTHEIINEQLFVYQARNFERKQFNTQGELVTLDNAAVVVGGGGVIPAWGQRISNIGCEHKWSVVVGRSKGGNDVAYWVNQELGAIVRFGYDGTVPISEVHLIDPFIQQQLTFLKGKDNPLSGQGICSVWNNVNKEYIITVRGRKDVPNWESAENYVVGNEVFYQPTTFSTYEQTGEIYIALQNNTNSNPELNPLDWALVPHTNPLYYNEYTLVFSEIQNGFSGFRTFKPKVYSQWTKTYLSANPINNTGEWYEHEKGEYCRFYESQEERGYDEFIVNTPTFTRKLYGVIRMQTTIAPVRVDFKTQHYQSYLEASDFTFRDGIYDSPIKYDSTVSADNPSGLNSLETAKLHDDWLKVKLFYDIGELQYINGFVIKFKLKPRLYTQ